MIQRKAFMIFLAALLAAWLLSGQALAVSPPRPKDVSAQQGGPDDFGYTWDDGEAFNWVDATVGSDLGLEEDDDFAGPVDMGFTFKFYENTYTQVYISTNGLLTFGRGDDSYDNRALPSEIPPQNLIAVFWDDLVVGPPSNNGKIYTLQGGTAPNRFFVVEWYQVSTGGANLLTFEAVLHENGDIVLQYLSLSGVLTEATVGIEDSLGIDGLTYVHNQAGLQDNLAVRFVRPAPSARVRVSPLYQSGFTQDGLRDFLLTVRNTGEKGADTYDFSVSGAWDVSLYQEDGITPLGDSDNDGIVDSGPIAERGQITITVSVQAPSGAGSGSFDTVEVTAQSSINSGKSASAVLQPAVSPSFVQGLMDNADGAFSFFVAQPKQQTLKKITADNYGGQTLALAMTHPGEYVYAWAKTQFTGDFVLISNIEYTGIDREGNILIPITQLTDHSAATQQTLDQFPTLAAAPDGHVGISWVRIIFDGTINAFNYNVYLAIIDPSGQPVGEAINLTKNDQFAGLGSLNVPTYRSAHIAASSDNRFGIAWVDERSLSEGEKGDIQFAVYDTQANELSPPASLTTSLPDEVRYQDPYVAALSAGRFFLAFSAYDTPSQLYTVQYAVLDSSGSILQPVSAIPGADGWRPAAVQLPSGRIVVAWTDTSASLQQAAFALLNEGTYDLFSGPTLLSNDEVSRNADYLSITTDRQGRAILTWMDVDLNQYLFYALVDDSGTVITPAMFFYQGQDPASPFVLSSFSGQGSQPFPPWFVYLPVAIR